jgi:hypothetical protein
MSYQVIKTINGRQYRYLQTSYRVGKKVKTKCVYLGPVSGNGTPFVAYSPAFDEKREMAMQEAQRAAEKARQERFTKEVGLKVGPDKPVPVEKPATSISYAPSASSPAPGQQAEQSPSDAPASEPSP